MESKKRERQLDDSTSKPKHKSLFSTRPSAAEFYGIQPNQREVEPALDTLGICQKPEIMSDTTKRFIELPSDYPDVVDFDVASEPPQVDFAIVQGLNPWFLPIDDQIHVSPLSAAGGFAMWSGFGAVRRGPDNCFYYSIGNHLYYGGNAYMLKYDPEKKTQSVCYELRKLLNWEPSMWTDGKIHGNPDIDKNGNMYVTTFSGPRPLHTDLDNIDYKGGHVIKYNIFTNDVQDLGIPLEGDTWCYSAYSAQLELLFAVGQAKHMVMAYDTTGQKLKYGGFPPPDISWWMRCILIDPDTGKVYSSNTLHRGQEMPFISWEPRNNTFRNLTLQSPVNSITGKREPLRAHTPIKDHNGVYWCFDEFGYIFTFNPVEETVEPIGINWGKTGKYTANLVISPKGRYLYYLPGAHNKMYQYGTPLVQFDTKTRKKKVLVFFNDFYIDKYGYNPYGAYGIEIDASGESVFFYTNGLFSSKEMGSGYGRPAIFHVHIPESERME